jgi:hypothetical protein
MVRVQVPSTSGAAAPPSGSRSPSGRFHAALRPLAQNLNQDRCSGGQQAEGERSECPTHDQNLSASGDRVPLEVLEPRDRRSDEKGQHNERSEKHVQRADQPSGFGAKSPQSAHRARTERVNRFL